MPSKANARAPARGETLDDIFAKLECLMNLLRVARYLDTRSDMTPEQIADVRSSFAAIRPISAKAAALFYTRLFQLDPSLRPMFARDLQEQGRISSLNKAWFGALYR